MKLSSKMVTALRSSVDRRSLIFRLYRRIRAETCHWRTAGRDLTKARDDVITVLAYPEAAFLGTTEGRRVQFCIWCQEAVDRSIEEIQAPSGDLLGRAA